MLNNSYSLLGMIKILIWIIRSKIINKNIRLIRFPIDIRGRKRIEFGIKLTTGIGCRLEVFGKDKKKKLFLGSNIQMNDYVHISVMDLVKIGNNVLIASHVYISDNSHGFYHGVKQTSPDIPPISREYFISPVEIGDNVWIGEGVIILPGVKIGKGSIIGAHAIVSKSIPGNSIAVGQPAQVIKRYDYKKGQWIHE